MEIKSLSSYVKEAIIAERDKTHSCLSEDDILQLTEEDSNDAVSENFESILTYPSYPLYRRIAGMLLLWLRNRKCPVLDLPDYCLLNEKQFIETRQSRIECVWQFLQGLQSLWDLWTPDEIRFRLHEIITTLGKRGLLDLLSVRQTVSTQEVWPPPRKVLLATVSMPHTPGSSLSVCARALSKHCHRDQSSSWWGVCTGTEAAKNEHALNKVVTILNTATWINIHMIVHDVQVIEVRQENGYGVRWLSDGTSFRGFLEPQMVDGHQVGWKH